MSRDSSTLDYFSRKNPQSTLACWRRYKIKTFLEEMVDTEVIGAECSPNLNLVINWKKTKKAQKDSFIKNWIFQKQFLILFAFLKMLNEDPIKMKAFFSEFLNGFFRSEYSPAREIAQAVYICVRDNLYTFLNAFEINSQIKTSRAKGLGASFEERGNPFSVGFEDHQILQPQKNEMLTELRNLGKASPNYQYASQTLSHLMRRNIRKQHPLPTKAIMGRIFAGVCFALALAAIAYLTIQTAGLIHLAWVIPVVILACTAGASAVVGGLVLAASTPSISNRVCTFFRASNKPKSSPGYEHQLPRGMLI